MQLTKYTDLSLRVLMYLAIHNEKIVTVTEIADHYEVSRNHLVKVVHKLSNLGWITAVRGRGGGLSLALAAGEIYVGDVVRAMETTLDVIDCEKGACPLRPACLLKDVLREGTQAFLKSLDAYSIEDLIRNKPQLLKLIG